MASTPPAVERGAHPLDRPLLRIVRETGATVGIIYLLTDDGDELRMASLTGATADLVSSWFRVPLSNSVPIADAVREDRVVWIGGHDDLARTYPRAAFALPYHFSLAAAPVGPATRRRGGLALLWPGSHPPQMSRHEHAGLLDACERLDQLLSRAAESGRPVRPGARPRVVAQPRARSLGLAEALGAADFADRLPEGGCSLDLAGRITFVSTTAAALMGGSVGELSGASLWEALPWLKDPVFEDRYRSAVVSRQPTSFRALRPPDRWLSFQLFPGPTGVSVRITPVHGDGRAGATPAPPSAPPGTPVRPGALYHLMHLAAALTEAVEVRDVIELVADQIMPAFDAQGFALLVNEGGRLRAIGHRGYPPEDLRAFEGTPLEGSRSPAALALTQGVGSFFPSIDDMARTYPEVAKWLRKRTDKAAWACLPLIASGHPVGACVLSYARPHPFIPDERAAMTSVAGLIAQALDRARMYDANMQLAQRLQVGLLPGELPSVPDLEVAARYLPATRGIDIGGDFYDLIRLDRTTAAASIGDVQGHNVTAAALMGQVRTAVHAAAGAAPGDVLAGANRLLTDLDPGLFTSCLYAHLDLASRTARLATAGHIPPVRCLANGDIQLVEVPPGLLLGIDRAAHYPQAEIPLAPGDVLALYTDGLVERPGTDIDDAITDLAHRLSRSRHLPLEALADTLVSRPEHTGSRSDDIALLLLRPGPLP